MRTAPSPPYLVPASDAVTEHAWTGHDGRAVPDRLEHWDPFTDLVLARSLDVDLDAVRDACGLGADATLALTATWSSSRTRLGGRASAIEFGQMKGLIRSTLEISIPASAAGGRLDLTTALLLRSGGAADSPVSPKREGAILWTEQFRTALEGTAARFPVTPVDFGETGRLSAGAGWALEWTTEDLDAPILGGLRLLINSSDDALLGALRSGATDPRSQAIRGFVVFDVAKTLVHTALRDEDFVAEPDAFNEESVGRVLADLIASCWPSVPVRALAVRLREDPSRLDADLQNHLGVFR